MVLNTLRAGKTSTKSTENPDGSVTTVTITYKSDGTKVTKRKTSSKRASSPQPGSPVRGSPAHFPSNDSRSRTLSPRLPSNDARSRTLSPKLPSNDARSRTPPQRSSSVKLLTRSSSVKMKRSSSTKNLVVEMVQEVKQELKKVLGVGHADNSIFASLVNRAIPAEIVLIASQDDVTQAQEGDTARKRYGLPEIPNTHGDSGSLATCALLQLLYENPKRLMPNKDVSPFDCRELLKEMQGRVMKCSNHEANPVISSSRPLGPPALKKDKYAPFYIVPPGFTGKRRALLISVVTGEGDDLKGPPNDTQYMHHFLTQNCGFLDEDILVLRDDVNAPPGSKKSTRENILDGFAQMVQKSKSKDVVFIQFSGHGGRLGDNLYILPCDYKEKGQIMDDEILKDLIKYMPANVHATMLVDCCYSGVIGELPYTLQSKEGTPEEQEIGTYYDTDTRQEMMEKEAAGDTEYQEKKKARSKWRNVNRIASVAKVYAKEMAKDMGKVAKQALDTGSSHLRSSVKAVESAGKATKQALDKGSDHLRSSFSSGPNGTEKENAKEEKPTAPAMDVESPAAKRLKSKSPPPRATAMPVQQIPRRSKANEDVAREMEEAAKKAAVAQSKTGAAKRGIPRRAKSSVDAAAAREAVANMAAAKKAAPKRGIPRRAKSSVDAAAAREAVANMAAVESAKKEAAATPYRTPPPRTKSSPPLGSPSTTTTGSAEDSVSKTKPVPRRKTPIRAKSAEAPPEDTIVIPKKKTPIRSKAIEDLAREFEAAERKAAVERSRREAAEARALAANTQP